MRLGIYDVLGLNWWEDQAEIELCRIAGGICQELIKVTADADPSVDNWARFSEFLDDFPAGSSVHDLIMFSQEVKNEGFTRFDYGPADNRKKYGQVSVPQVPLDSIRVPIALVHGEYDELSTPADVEWLTTQLTQGQVVFNQMYPLGHLSFSLALDMDWFKTDVMGVIDKYATNSLQ